MTSSRKVIFPIGALLAIIALAAGVMIVRASADELLHNAARMMADAQSGHAVISFEMQTPEETQSGTVEVWGRKDAGPNGEPAFRIHVLQASKEKAQGVIAVSDGTQGWLYRPDENTVYVGTVEELKAKMREVAEQRDFQEWDEFDHDMPDYEEGDHPETPEEAVDKLLEYVTAERAGTENINGQAANHLRLIPIAEKMPEEFRANGGLFHVYLRVSDNAPLAAEYTDGAVGSAKINASDVQIYGPDEAGLDDSVFTFDIPEGATVVPISEIEPPALSPEEAAKLDGFQVLSPTSLPSAARLDDTVEIRGAVVQRYRLPDGKDFTVAQGVAGAADTPQDSEGETISVRGVEGAIFTDDSGLRTLLTWSEGDVTFWIGGDLTADQALQIANSLE